MNIWYHQLNVYSVKILALLLFIILWTNGYTFFACTLFYFAVVVGSYVLENTSLRKNSFGPKEAVIITGCDSGLGYGLALHCHSLGAAVFAGVHNEHSPGAEKLRELKIPVFPLEVTSQSSIDIFCEIISRMIKEHGLHLNALINNAGVMVFGEFEWQTKSQIADQINVNLVGTINVTQKFLPLVRSHKSRIVIVCSHCSLESLPGFSIYGATKAGLLAFATSLRVELKKFDVSVVSFIPGSFVMESNIMSKQKTHFQEQRQNMSDEARKIYGEYFDRHEQYLLPIIRTNDLVKLSNENVFKTFEGCIFDKYPRPIYKCEPWRYKWYHTLWKITPTWLRDRLVQKFVATPEWKIDNS